LIRTQQITLVAIAELDVARREILLLEHLPQVQCIARSIHNHLPPQVLLEDLVHAGVLGLMDAVRKYDPSKKIQLKYYAQFRIRGAILDSLRQEDWSSRALRRQARRLEQAIVDCKGKFAREPTEVELAAELGMSLEQLQRLTRDLRGLDVRSLQVDTVGASDATEAVQCGPASVEEDPYHQTLRSEMKHLLARAVAELPERERRVVDLHHFECLTMKEVAAALGICESRVSQIHTAAVLRLRVGLRELMENRPSVVAANPAKFVSAARRAPLAHLVRGGFDRGAELPAIRRAS
jgi:RNA polymerase sigma factor FliA